MKLRFWLFLLLPALSSAQVSTIRSVSSLPATCNPGGGAGGAPQDVVSLFNAGTSTLYNCTSTNTWTAAGGNPPFNQITSGTNTGAAMVVGTGASLGTSGSGTIAATSAPYNGISSGTNTAAAMVNNTGASTKPQNIGQVAGSQVWLASAVTPTSAAFTSNSGGSISTAGLTVQITYVSAAGETLPSVTFPTTNPGGICASSNCQVTITGPSSLPSGFTGWTAYDCLGSNCTPLLKQAASANCVNLAAGVNCVVSTVAAGSGVPTTLTAWVQPPNIQSGLTPYSSTPSLFFPKTDGNYYPLAGMDFSSGSPLPSPDGTFEFWHRTFVNDSGQALAQGTQQGAGCIKNTLFSICHLSSQTTSTGSSTDDRAISVRSTDSPSSPTYEQWLGYYGEHFIYNNNFACNPVGFEDCAAALRVRTNDQRTAGVNNANFTGMSGTATTNVAAPKLGSCLPCVVGVKGYAGQETVTSQNAASAFYAGVVGIVNASTSNTNGNGFALWAAPYSVRFAGQTGALFIPSGFNNTADFVIRADSTARSKWLGPMLFGNSTHAFGTDAGTLNTYGSIDVLAGSLTATAFPTPTFGNGNVSHAGAAGAATWTYKVIATDGNGGTTAASAAGSTTTGNATLDTNNFNIITINFCNSGVPFGWSTIKVYRTVSGGTPSSTGLIGTITPSDLLSNGAALTTCNFVLNDQGAAGDSTTPPTGNTSGGVQAGGYVRGSLNTVQKTASDFTTSSATLVTLFTWNLPLVAANYSFDCKLVYSQQTAAAGLLLGIESANVAPTSLMASARIFTTNTGTSTDATSTITTTTATTVLTGAAPGATNTNYQADMYGTIEAPATAPGISLNVKVATANASDQITILRGSYCQLY